MKAEMLEAKQKVQYESNKHVESVQWLRGIAALMVVIHHARNAAPWIFNPLENYNAFAWGVDIFFVISGFIIFVAARDEPPLMFLKRRVVRVVPLYWITTIVLIILSYRLRLFSLDPSETEHITKSLFLIPHYNPKHPDQIWPFLIPGWTLIYEMFFYLIFFIGLLAKRPLFVTTIVILSLVMLGLLLAPQDAVFKTFTSLQMLEFITGMLIGKLYTEKSIPSIFIVLLPLGLIGLFLPNTLSLGLPSRILFSSFILIGTIVADRYITGIRVLKELGDASYSIYLSHTILALPLGKKILSLTSLQGWFQFSLWLVISVLCSAAIGYLIHRLIEKPIITWMRRRLIHAAD